MFGMGLGLRVADFTRLLRLPRAIGLGLAAQILMIPALGYLLASQVPMREAFAVGLMVIAVTPGGAVSNLWTYLARGDLALSVTLTATSSLLAVFTVPVILNLALLGLLGEAVQLRLPVLQTMQHIAMITVIPVSLGMGIRAALPGIADRADRPVRILSVLFLALAVGGIMIRERASLGELIVTAGPPVLALNLAAMLLGYLLARLARLGPRQVTTLSIEVGIQNVILSATLAVAPQFLGRTDIGLVPSVYGLTMSVLVISFIVCTRLWPALLGPPEPVRKPG